MVLRRTKMTYEETLQYLYNQLPVFQQVGATAYKPGLGNSLALDRYFGHPHTRFRSIHVGGTNGKGSTSHLLAAILQKSGYKVGLYTSPHLVDFRERIRINGRMIPKSYVMTFTENHLEATRHIAPSFFELTMMLAFDYFASEGVDVAVIEVGLGGRLDSTNIITPDLSIITNISFDHTQFLGHTLTDIAREKAGIIKPGVPVVIGEAEGEVKQVFSETASRQGAEIHFADTENDIAQSVITESGQWRFDSAEYPNLTGELGGYCQEKNAATVLTAVSILKQSGYAIPTDAVYQGFAQVIEITGLQGRWQKIGSSPLIVCDTGHNTGGMAYIVRQLKQTPCKQLRIVIGMVNDKDINGVLRMLPRDAVYYFTQASVKRALPADEMQRMAAVHGLNGRAFSSVQEAYRQALCESDKEDFIFVGGSTFVVADFLSDHPAD